MEPSTLTIRRILISFVILLALMGCSLFNLFDNPAAERAEENQAITQGVEFGEVVMAEGIGERNAPVSVTNSFSSSQDFIYVVAEADRIEAGTTLFARWSRDGEPFEDSSEITADQDYEDTYVEFHLENLEDQMEAGDYSVQIFVNGNPAVEEEFTVE